MSTLSTPSFSMGFSANETLAGFNLNLRQSPDINIGVSSAAGTFPVATADLAVSIPFSVTSGTPYVYNVLSGLDNFSQPLAMLTLLAVIVENDGVLTPGVITVGSGTHPTSANVLVVQRGGCASYFNPDGITIVTSVNDQITITCASGTISGILSLVGRST